MGLLESPPNFLQHSLPAATAMKVVTATELLDLVRGFCLGSLSLALLNRVTDWVAPEGDVRARHRVPCYNRQGRLDSEYHEHGNHDPQYTLCSPARPGMTLPGTASDLATWGRHRGLYGAPRQKGGAHSQGR